MEGRHWALRKLSHETIKQMEPELATVRFRDDGRIDGTTSCNGISASLTWSHDHANGQSGLLRNDGRPSIQTVVGCGNRWATTIANGFWKKMETAERWSRRGNRLRIAFTGGRYGRSGVSSSARFPPETGLQAAWIDQLRLCKPSIIGETHEPIALMKPRGSTGQPDG